MDRSHVTLFVCVSCRRPLGGDGEDAFDLPGAALAERLAARLKDTGTITVAPVDCLAVCARPCTVALAGHGKWTYVVGDLDGLAHVDDIVAAALSYGATDNGIIPWKERPLAFRKGVVSRVPPVAPAQDSNA